MAEARKMCEFPKEKVKQRRGPSTHRWWCPWKREGDAASHSSDPAEAERAASTCGEAEAPVERPSAPRAAGFLWSRGAGIPPTAPRVTECLPLGCLCTSVGPREVRPLLDVCGVCKDQEGTPPEMYAWRARIQTCGTKEKHLDLNPLCGL